ncbi:MAG: hypothetical protein KA807_10715 [Prolixibacteraceae bacterium]|nr:hypothetical protein [Prolixibacteraceae bacterium]
MKTQNLGIVMILAIGLFSCQSDDVITSLTGDDVLNTKSATLASTDVAAECILGDVDLEADYYTYAQKVLKQVAKLTDNSRKITNSHFMDKFYSGDGPMISIDTAETGYPIIISIDYGDTTVTKHGKVLSGTIILEISGDKNTDGATRKVTYENFFVDSVSLTGSKSEIFNFTADSILVITSSGNIVLTLPDGSTITAATEKQRTWIEGDDTPFEHDDDILQVTGKTEFTTSEGESFVKETLIPLLRTGDCHNFVQGTVRYVQDGAEIAVLDYGDGECDEVATLTTADGETIEIELRGSKLHGQNGNYNAENNGKGKGKGKGNGKG